MEREFKWTATRAAFDTICARCDGLLSMLRTIDMDAVYYDTADRALRAQKIGLRLRRENGATVFCVKTGGTVENGLHAHEEYEYEAYDLAQGLAQLPEELSMLRERDYRPICATHIRRTAFTLDGGDFTAELTFDEGTLEGGGRTAPVAEIELELKRGEEGSFEAFGGALAAEFGLAAQPLSKLARALALAD